MKRFFLILIFPALTMCKNYYNETIEWADNLKIGTSIEVVKNNRPDFLEIEWDEPDTLDDELLYKIIKIKGNRDILKMSHYLVFIDGKYQGRNQYK